MRVTENTVKLVQEKLLKWFDVHGRSYPWRRTSDPYRILIAEIMLQRTKAEQVLPIYTAFLEKFPDVRSLAQASLEEIKEFFRKLGLVWRAEKVKSLAATLLSRYNGGIPAKREELMSLPSIGDYVADAVLCFAYSKDIAVIDANVCRVISRLFGVELRREARRDPKLRELAHQLVPAGKAKEFNWAMIDLASLLCVPRIPRCTKCPLRGVCLYIISSNKQLK